MDKKRITEFRSSMIKILCKYSMFLLVTILFYLCTKKKVPLKNNEIVSSPSPVISNDYRDAFTGTYSGVVIAWYGGFTPPNTSWSTEYPPASYTVVISKAVNTDSMICASEFMYPNTSSDTILIKPTGVFSLSGNPFSSSVKFKGDSVLIDVVKQSGANGWILDGKKYRCKKNS